ncbi:MAG TPA: energy transducer TonB [Candidatus Obscuribacterales bacterium]
MTKHAMSLAFILLLSSSIAASGSKKALHCGFAPENVWANPYRAAILQANRVIKKNLEGTTVVEITNEPLVTKPVSCMFSFSSHSGKLVNLRILVSSGDKEVDQTALKLIRNAAPFKFDPRYSRSGESLVAHFTSSDVIVSRSESRQTVCNEPKASP